MIPYALLFVFFTMLTICTMLYQLNIPYKQVVVQCEHTIIYYPALSEEKIGYDIFNQNCR